MIYQNILAPIDGSSVSMAAVKHAITLSKTFQCQLSIISIVAVDPFKGIDFYSALPNLKDYYLAAKAEAEKLLDEVNQLCIEQNVKADTRVVMGEIPSVGILKIAAEVKADLIVMGSHGHKGLQKYMLGSVAQEVLTNTETQVMIIKQ